ncbi:Neurexin-4-like 1 [Homarus americanus]|uniref:Neurexin-4-like 1 n=1 Tax=Homarus americanus TaxID=6706 RepID=A0A8J5JHV0_HOMAM|nr:Neurexin-4-like 1 [Homarus americanus]
MLVWPGLLLLGLGLLAHLVTTSPLPQSDYYDDNYAADTKPEAINGGSEPAVDPKTEAEIPTDTETEVKLDEPLGESLPAPAEGEVLVGAAVDSPPAIPGVNTDNELDPAEAVPGSAEDSVEDAGRPPAGDTDAMSPSNVDTPAGDEVLVPAEAEVLVEPILAEPALSVDPESPTELEAPVGPSLSVGLETPVESEPSSIPKISPRINLVIEPENSTDVEKSIDLEPGTEPTKRTENNATEGSVASESARTDHPPKENILLNLDESCTHPPDTELCRGHFPKFYFDPASKTCRNFVYGGCRGNKNIYKTAADCYAKCYPAHLTKHSHAVRGSVSEKNYLALKGGTSVSTLTFVGNNAAARVDDQALTQFSIKTDSPHGLIAFLRQVTVPPELQGTRIQLYIYLKRGHLSLTHVFGNNSETFIMNKGGLQEGSWHNALVMVDATRGHLIMEVDASQEDFTINSLVNFPSYTSGNALHGFSSRLWIGGVYKGDLEKEDAVAGFLPYHGCLRDVSVLSGVTSEDMAYVKPLFTSKHFGVREHCGDNCHDRHRNLCSPSSQCVEHFDHSTCKCFNSGQDGRRCSNPDLPVLTLNNDGYVVHRLYEWMDRVHSSNNFISLEFKSRFGDSILFYASAEHPEKQYMGATLTASGRVYVEADFGGGKVGTEIGEGLDSGLWFLLTIIHQHDQLQIYLDGKHEETLTVPGEVHYLHLDPDLYIGNAPGLARSLRSLNTFLGCMRKVFFNDISILNQLREGNKTTRYFGVTQNPPVSSTCNENGMVQVTLSTEKASINLTNPNPTNFRIIVSFRPVRSHGVLASGHVDVLDTKTMWELRHDEHHVFFFVHDNLVHLRPKDKIKIGHWQYVDVRYENNRVTMRVNQDTKSTKPPGPLAFSSRLTIGAPILDAFPGFIGCLRKLEVGGEKVDLRSVVGTTLVDKDVTFDNCQVLGPCERPGSCEHGASCTVVDDDVQCDCSGTGYTGKRCHFSLYKRSCEQYRQIGYTNSGIYKIDVDGNGPLPAAYVKCRFSEFTGETVTIVEHNLPENYEVRRPHVDNVQVQIQYRDFAPNMFKSLISQSNSCTQKVRYDCRRSPLRLYSRTWLSSPSKDFITNFGAKVPGLCRCGEANSCDELDVMCNCDIGDGLPRTDKGTLRDPEHLPITSMVFLQDPREKEDTEGLITLGPLKCIKEASADQTVSFTKPGGYLEVPAWREGSLFLSFKTTTKKAVIAYQPAYHPAHASFKIALTGDKVVELTYTFREETYRHRLSTSRHLNTGSWQQILIDIHDHQLRLAVNSDEEVIDIDQDTRLGVLDGTMYLGAIPPELLTDEDKQEGLEGLVGCIRGLTLNDEVIDLKPFIRVSAHGVTYGCTPSCDPNPCKNGASCIEKWGTYECICKNPLAHSGKNCENNINENAITFITEVSKFKYFVNDTESLGEHNLLNESFLINFRTHINKGLILFAYDYLHNFVQLYLAAENEVVLIFNSGHDVHKLVVTADAGVVFTKGQSVQVSVERSFASTSLRVFTNGVFFNVSLDAGLLLLHEDEYNQFPFGESRPLHEIVYYPHSVTKPKPFFQAYMGSATDKQHDVTSVIPGLVGCIRGLQIGSRPVSLTKLISKSSFPVDDIKVNCSMACDLRPCLNGGFCTEDFQFYNNFHCDCADTSYSGPTCATEIGYTFSGRQWISKDSTTSPIKENFRFELAFSSSKRHSNPQLVALLRSTDVDTAHDYLLVAIERDGSLLVEAQLSDLNQEMVLGAKDISPDHDFSAFDGYRHYVIVEKTDSGMTLKVDRKEHQILPLKNIYVSETGVKTTPTGLYLGGVEAGVDDRLGQYDSFHGCISNVKVLSPDGEAQILKLYKENDMHFKNYGIPGLGSCAGFAGVGAPSIRMTYSNNLNTSAVMGPEWAFRMAQRFTYDVDYVAPSHPERDTRMDDGTIFLLTAILIFVLLLRSHQKRKKTKAHQMDLEEQQPLFNGSRRTKVSTQTEMVSLKAASDGVNQAVKEEPVKDVGIKLEEVPLRETPEEVEQKPEVATKQEPLNGVQVRKVGKSEDGADNGERPLSWDKSVDNLPLIIGSQGQPTGDTSSESSIDCVIDINDSPTSSPTSPKKSVRALLTSGFIGASSPSCGHQDDEEPYGDKEAEDEGVVLVREKYSPFDSEECRCPGNGTPLEDEMTEGGDGGTVKDVDGESVEVLRQEEDTVTVSDSYSLSSFSDSIIRDALHRAIDISLVPSVEELLGSGTDSLSISDISDNQLMEQSTDFPEDIQGIDIFNEPPEVLGPSESHLSKGVSEADGED